MGWIEKSKTGTVLTDGGQRRLLPDGSNSRVE